MPIVLATRTIRLGGQDIDDAIVRQWIKKKDLKEKLPKDGEFSETLSIYLRKKAKETKESANPRITSNKPNELEELLESPLGGQVKVQLPPEPFIYTRGKGDGPISITPPELTQEDFNQIMPPFINRIDEEINYFFGLVDKEAIEQIVLSGGSSYIRQFIQFVKQKFIYLEEEHEKFTNWILFEEPENAIAYGASLFQHSLLKGKNSIVSTLSMSTYLEVDYDHREIPQIQLTASGVNFIRHDGRSFIELGRKGDELNIKKPRLRPPDAKIIFPPVHPRKKKIKWKIYQVRSTNTNGRDYEEIKPSTKPVDEIDISLRKKPGKILALIRPVRFIYAFDIYSDLFHSVRIDFRSRRGTKWKKAPEFDWRKSDRIDEFCNKYFYGDRENK
jgi:hypothetical protein